MSIDGLTEREQKILKMFKVPEFLIELVSEWVGDAWSEGSSTCQGDYYGVDVD